MRLAKLISFLLFLICIQCKQSKYVDSTRSAQPLLATKSGVSEKEMKKICELYAQKYNKYLESNNKQTDRTNLSSNGKKNLLYSYCINRFKSLMPKNADKTANPSTQSTNQKPDPQTVQKTSEVMNENLKNTDIPLDNEENADQRPLRLFEPEPTQVLSVSNKSQFSSIIDTAITPLMLSGQQGNGLTALKQNPYEIGPVLEPEQFDLTEGASKKQRIIQTVKNLSHGLGVGIGVGASAGMGVGAGASFGLELVYLREGTESKPGEIALFCYPQLDLPLLKFGASASFTVTGLKALGCGNASTYEGGFLSFNIDLKVATVGLSLGIDPVGLIYFLDYIKNGGWQNHFNARDLEIEIKKVKDRFFHRIKNTNSSIEIIMFYFYIHLLSSILEKHKDIEIVGSLKLLVEMTKNLVMSIFSFDFLKSTYKYPGAPQAFEKMLDLMPETEFPFSSHIIRKLKPHFGGCDSISVTYTPVDTNTSYTPLFAPTISYSYYVNPEFTGIGDNSQRDRKAILELDTIGNFFDPLSLTEKSNTSSANVFTLTDSELESVFETQPYQMQEEPTGRLSLIFKGVPGFDPHGPLSFIAKLASFIPRIGKDCLAPAVPHLKEIYKGLRFLYKDVNVKNYYNNK